MNDVGGEGNFFYCGVYREVTATSRERANNAEWAGLREKEGVQ